MPGWSRSPRCRRHPGSGTAHPRHRELRRASIVVNADGSIDVTETITARFSGKWNGIYRTVPVDYHTPQGFNWSLRLSETSATGPDGSAAQAREQPHRPLPEVQDLGARRRGCHAHRLVPLQGGEWPPVLRGPRRALLEHHRRRMGRADRGGQCHDHACPRVPMVSGPSPSMATMAAGPRTRR